MTDDNLPSSSSLTAADLLPPPAPPATSSSSSPLPAPPSLPVTPTLGPAFDPTHVPAVRPRARASSISFDLAPFKLLHQSLEADHAQAVALNEGEEAADGRMPEDEGAEADDASNPWRRGGGFDREEVRRALGELLFHVEGLTTRLHAALTRQLETEHELKIARSNLMLTEANVEMLEESIRRGGQFGQAMVQQTQRKAGPPAPIAIPTSSSATPAGLSSPVQLSIPPLDRSTSDLSSTTRTRNHTAPSPAPPPSPGGSAPTGSWLSKWGFSPSQSGEPSARTSAGTASELGRSTLAGSTPNLNTMQSPASATAHVRAAHGPSQSTSAVHPSQAAAVAALKTSLAEAQTLSSSLARELAAVKDAKHALEGELEDLTGQLFEEANLLVAEERQRSAAREEEASEARREREAMRQTVKVVEEDCRQLRELVERLGGAEAQSRRIPLKKGSSRSLRSNLSSVSRAAWAEESPVADDDGGEQRLSELMRNMASDMDDPAALATPTSATFPPHSPGSGGLHSPEPLRTRSPTPSFRSAAPPSPSRMPKSPSASSFQSFSSDGGGSSVGSHVGGYRALPAEAGGKGRKVLLLPQTQQQG